MAVVALIMGWIFGINPWSLLGLYGRRQRRWRPGRATAARARAGTPANDASRHRLAEVLVQHRGGRTMSSASPAAPTSRPSWCSSGRWPPCLRPGGAMPPWARSIARTIGRSTSDLSFYDTLAAQASARRGNSRRPTCIAHEVGHHVQNQLGIMQESRCTARPGQRGPSANAAQRADRAASRLLRRRLGQPLAEAERAGALDPATSRRR